MFNLNQKTILSLFLFVFYFANISSQDVLPTGAIEHDFIDFPVTPIVSSQLEVLDDLNYFQVAFSSESALDTYYDGISTTPPNYATEMRYFWTFGDGHISYDSNPVHQYAISGTYEVTFQATPIYSPKPPPPLMKIDVNTSGSLNGVLDVSSSAGALPLTFGGLYLKGEILRNFRSDFESSMIVTYRNRTSQTANDVIQVYYNPQKVDAVALYSFQGETVVSVGDLNTNSTLVEELDASELRMLSIPFYDLEPSETRRLVIQFVSNNSSTIFDPAIYFGVNFQNGNIPLVPYIQSSLRKSWDPNAKEAFVDYISPLNMPNTVKYRIFMENIGSESTYKIAVLDRVHSVLNIDPNNHAIVDAKYPIDWIYQPNYGGYKVRYFAPEFNLPGQSPELDIENSKYWFDVVYELDNPRLQEIIMNSNRNCKNGEYLFGRNAKITFDENDPSINTNTPYITVGCPSVGVSNCIKIKKLFPNPAYNNGTIEYEISESLQKPLDVFAVSKLGDMILIASNLSATKGVHNYNLDFTNLKPDVYQLIIRNKYCSAKLEGFIKK